MEAILLAILLLPVTIVLATWICPLLLLHWGTKLLKAHRLVEAESMLSLGLKLARATDGYIAKLGISRSSTPLPQLLFGLSLCYFKQSKFDKSFVLDEERLQLLEKAGEYAAAASASARLGVSYMLRGDLDRAVSLSERAGAVIESSYRNSQKDNAPQIEKLQTSLYAAELGSAMYGRAWILKVLRQYAEAETVARRVLEIMEGQFGGECLQITPYLINVGEISRLQGKLVEAEEPLLRSLQLREQLKASELLLASAQQAVGDLYRDQGKLSEAKPLLEKAYLTAKRLEPADSAGLAEFAVSLGLLRIAEDNTGEAESLLCGALAVREKQFGSLNPLLLGCLEAMRQVSFKSEKIDTIETENRITAICRRWAVEPKTNYESN